jgi:uncharacterized membrane protein (DUF2068 family)
MSVTQQRAPFALRTIALFEIVKGALVLAAVCGLLSLRHTDLHAAADAFLIRHGFNPERHYPRLFIETMASATHEHVGKIIAIGVAYVVLRFVEGYGLWRAKRWAEWVAVISAGIYLPFEFEHLAFHRNLASASVIVGNIIIMIYLAKLLIQQRARHVREASSQISDC